MDKLPHLGDRLLRNVLRPVLHQEGRSQAVKLFDQELGELDASRREQFFSASIAELMDL